jgi:ATP-binding cassette subfamily B protein
MAEPIEIDIKNGITVNQPFGDIVFENVSFKYPESVADAISNVSFTIPAGSKIAFVGRTGSGKTTLAQLIPRMYEPTDGKITLNGTDLKDYSLESLRLNIGFVPQESFLFSDTIAENIAFGIESIDYKRIEQAAEKAQLLDSILDFDKQFMTVLGERGITLSGGQKQRTSIARALIKEPGLLILDDSLSAVDSKTEEALTRVMKETLPNATTILIAHRLSTIMHCDTIHMLEHGKIIESGTHEYLIALNGAYASMYRKQLIEQEIEAL